MLVPVLGGLGACAESPGFGEFGILLYLYPPALVFGQMPMEAVDLVCRADIQEALDCLYAEEVAGAVEVDAPVGETGLVLNGAAGDAPLGSVSGLSAEDFDGKQLLEGAQGIEETIFAGCRDLCGIAHDFNSVFFLVKRRILQEIYAFSIEKHQFSLIFICYASSQIVCKRSVTTLYYYNLRRESRHP